MILTGEILSAQQAEQVGLVSKVVPMDELWDAAKEKAEKIVPRDLLL